MKFYDYRNKLNIEDIIMIKFQWNQFIVGNNPSLLRYSLKYNPETGLYI